MRRLFGGGGLLGPQWWVGVLDPKWWVRRAWTLYGLGLEYRYLGRLIGFRDLPTRFPEQGANFTQNIPYVSLARLSEQVRVSPDDVLVDVGCGLGRVILWWLHTTGGHGRIVGLELDPEIGERTRGLFMRYPNVSIITGSAVDVVPPTATLLYLFNPFNEEVLARFNDRVKEIRAGQRTRIVYVNACHVGVFEADPSWDVRCLDYDLFQTYLMTLRSPEDREVAVQNPRQ